VTAFTEKLMIYALGRGLEYYDMPAVRAIVAESGRRGYRFSSLVVGIVGSVPFQMRASAPQESPATRAAR
jgi:predicted GTPase